jgi:hypothetical protein
MKQRYRRLTELFVQGTAVKMPDDTHLWVQTINSFEREECLSDAQVARARLIMALKAQGDERVKVEGRLTEVGRDAFVADLAEARASAKGSDIAEEMRDDPEWKDRMLVVLRTDWDQASSPPTEEETQVMEQIQAEIVNEMYRREGEEREFLERKLHRLSDDELIDEWVEEWIERRGTALAGQEYRLTELWYATRFCEAAPGEDGALDHTRCDGHRERVFESKQDARSAPTALQDLLRNALDDVNLAGRDPKDLANPENSSDSSPTPNEPGESTPSTSTETPAKAPGT